MIKAKSVFKTNISFKIQLLAAAIATAAAVALPQLCHALGAAIGVNSAIGEVLLPMHLPVILVSLIAGPYAGLAAGILSPIISYYLTAMPRLALLPFMVIELACYGFFAGILKDVKINTVLKILIAQILGRAIRAIAIAVGFYMLESSIEPSIILTSLKSGLAGIALQLILIPCIISALKSNEQ